MSHIIVDWFNPDTWKAPAALAEHWQKIALAVIAIGGAVGAGAKWGGASIRWIRSKFSTRGEAIATDRPLRFVTDESQSFWAPMRLGEQEGIQVRGVWHVTNVSHRGVVLLRARLLNHEADHVETEGKGRNPTYHSRNAIPAGQLSEVVVSFRIFPPITKGAESLIADVVFTDNYEEQHQVRRVRFRNVRVRHAGC